MSLRLIWGWMMGRELVRRLEVDRVWMVVVDMGREAGMGRVGVEVREGRVRGVKTS